MRRTLLRAAWPPVVAFAAQRGVLIAVAFASGFNPFHADAWAKWDSAFYLHIAASGYLPPEPCPPESHYPATAWCGNTGWFPGYPWLAAAIARLSSAQIGAAAVFVSAAAQLTCLILIWRMLDDDRQWPALALAAFCPGNVYLSAVFPLSCCLAAALACIALCWSGRHALAAVAAACSALCYPLGVLLAPVIAAWALLHRRWRALLSAGGALAGFLAVLATMKVQTGAWDAFTRVQAKYAFSGDPLDALGARLKPLVNRRYRDEKGVVTALQTLISTTLVVGLFLDGLRRRWSERSSLVLLYVAAFWLVPLAVGGRLSLYRSEALLLPAALLVPTLGRTLQLVLAVAAVALSVPMAWLFFRGVLV